MSRFGLEVGNELDRQSWTRFSTGVQNVSSGPRLECGHRSAWVEVVDRGLWVGGRLDGLWQKPRALFSRHVWLGLVRALDVGLVFELVG